jgi:hypothetical protein
MVIEQQRNAQARAVNQELNRHQTQADEEPARALLGRI